MGESGICPYFDGATRPTAASKYSEHRFRDLDLQGIRQRQTRCLMEQGPAKFGAVGKYPSAGIYSDQRWHYPYQSFQRHVFGLTPESRSVIYSALSQFPENREQHEPFRFRADAEDEWWKNSGLNPETLAAVKRLIYRRGSAVLFSDISLLLPTIKSFEERTRLLKTLARKSTLLVKLQLNPQTDIEALENYWGGTGNKDIGPLLRSLTQHSNGATIDIVHLLPPFARSRLYTYPSINNPDSVTFMDCHWTVLNFFNSEPDEKYEDINEVTIAFRNNYYPVAGRPKFGDIYLFALPNGDIIHSCVFIADDIVFTKNGASATSPWILMNLQDVIAYYPSDQPLDIQRYRPKFL